MDVFEKREVGGDKKHLIFLINKKTERKKKTSVQRESGRNSAESHSEGGRGMARENGNNKKNSLSPNRKERPFKDTHAGAELSSESIPSFLSTSFAAL